MPARRSSPPVTSVEDSAQLATICRKCRADKRFAFDTEFVMEDRFEPEVCLVQIATAEEVAIIDPLHGLDLAPVWELVCDPQVETVVHAGQEDLSLCVQHTARVPRRIYDVQIAAGLAGYDYPLSLQKLVQQALHIRLHKTKTLTDWRKRPLTDAQVRYAAEDVCHLLAVRDKIDARLERLKRRDWATEEFARFEDPTLYRRAEEEKLTRVKGAGALNGRQLCIVRELLAWREELARKRNRPVRSVLRDHLLVEIAKHEITAFSEVRDLRGINLADRDVKALCRVVQRAVDMPSEQWPSPRPREMEPEWETPLIAMITAIVRSLCREQDIAYGLAATKKSIRDLIAYCTRSRRINKAAVELLNGWRREALGELLVDVLQGRRTVTVDPAGEEPVIRVT